MVRIRDVYSGSRIRIFSIPDSGSALNNILPHKIGFETLVRVVYPRSRSQILFYYPSRIPGGQNGTGSRIRIRNTASLKHLTVQYTCEWYSVSGCTPRHGRAGSCSSASPAPWPRGAPWARAPATSAHSSPAQCRYSPRPQSRVANKNPPKKTQKTP